MINSSLTYFAQMSYDDQSDKLAGAIGLLKQLVVPREHSPLRSHFHRYITRTGREIAEDAAQIFGGRSVTVTGMGKLIENVCPTSSPLPRADIILNCL